MASDRLRSGTIVTIAGSGRLGDTWEGGPAVQAALNRPFRLAVASDGTVYVSDHFNHRVCAIFPSGELRIVAGTGEAGFSGDGGQARAARLRAPVGIAVAGDGSLYVADGEADRVRRVAPDGVIWTVAGTGNTGSGPDGTLATDCPLHSPMGVAVADDGSVYVAETDAHRVRVVHPGGRIGTVAGTGTAGYAGDGGPAAAAQLHRPVSVAVAPQRGLLIADPGNGRIRCVHADGTITTLAGNGERGFGGDGGPAASARLGVPADAAAGPDGTVFIADYYNDRIRAVLPDGTIRTVAGNGRRGYAGDGGPALEASLDHPRGVALTGDGDLVIADTENARVRLVHRPLSTL